MIFRRKKIPLHIRVQRTQINAVNDLPFEQVPPLWRRFLTLAFYLFLLGSIMVILVGHEHL